MIPWLCQIKLERAVTMVRADLDHASYYKKIFIQNDHNLITNCDFVATTLCHSGPQSLQ